MGLWNHDFLDRLLTRRPHTWALELPGCGNEALIWAEMGTLGTASSRAADSQKLLLPAAAAFAWGLPVSVPACLTGPPPLL